MAFGKFFNKLEVVEEDKNLLIELICDYPMHVLKRVLGLAKFKPKYDEVKKQLFGI